MNEIRSFTVGLPVPELQGAVAWYRRLLGTVDEINPARGIWEFRIVPSGWLQLFECKCAEPNPSVLRFECPDIEATRRRLSELDIPSTPIEIIPNAVRYLEFRDPFGNRLSFYEMLK